MYPYSAFQFTLLNKLKLSSNNAFDRLVQVTSWHYSAFLPLRCPSLHSFPLFCELFSFTFVYALLSGQSCIILWCEGYHWWFVS